MGWGVRHQGRVADVYMNESLVRIREDPSHPLSFLIDKTIGAWKGRLPKGEFGVVAGHRDSRRACEHWDGELHLALEEAWQNDQHGRIEALQPILGEATINIGGVFVDLDSAIAWQRRGYFDDMVYKNADFNDRSKFPLLNKGWQPQECH